MAGIYPAINETDYTLWKAITWNYYEYAIRLGVDTLNPPHVNDTQFDLMKKAAYYSAAAVDLHI